MLLSSVATRAVTESERPVRTVGEILFAAVFTGSVFGKYAASRATAQERGEPLRVILRIDAPDLAALPWEAMFDGERGGYLSRREPLVRHVPASSAAPLRVSGPLRILGIVASPRGLRELDVEEEKRRLIEALREPLADGRVELIWAPGGTWSEIQSKLLDGVWHVVHFIGHGGYDEETQEDLLALVGTDGRKEARRRTPLCRSFGGGATKPSPSRVELLLVGRVWYR